MSSPTTPSATHEHSGDSRRFALSPEEAAEALGVGRTTIYELLASGRIASIRVGRRRLVPIWAIDAFLGSPSPTFPGPDNAAS